LKDHKIIWVFVTSSHISIDIFHMLSAFFVSHSFLRVSREYDGMSFGTLIQIYLGRLFRFAPLLFIFTIVSWQIVSSKVLENDL